MSTVQCTEDSFVYLSSIYIQRYHGHDKPLQISWFHIEFISIDTRILINDRGPRSIDYSGQYEDDFVTHLINKYKYNLLGSFSDASEKKTQYFCRFNYFSNALSIMKSIVNESILKVSHIESESISNRWIFILLIFVLFRIELCWINAYHDVQWLTMYFVLYK